MDEIERLKAVALQAQNAAIDLAKENERLRGLIRHILGDRITPEAYLLYGKAWVDEAHAALGAPRPEPVAWQYKDEPSFDGNCWHDNYQVTTSKQVAQFKDKNAQPLYAAPPAAAPRPEPGPEPATDAKLLLAYRQRGCGFYMEFREIWQAAERFHGITKEDKT